MFSKSDYKSFDRAKEIATNSDFSKTHIGCVAIYQGNVIASGCNSNKTHPLQEYYNKYRKHNQDILFSAKLHAEISCLSSIKDLDINFQKVKLYIYRQKKNGELGMSRPCKSCMAMINDLGIQHIYYTTDVGFAYENIKRKVREIA